MPTMGKKGSENIAIEMDGVGKIVFSAWVRWSCVSAQTWLTYDHTILIRSKEYPT